MSTSSVRNII